MTRHGKRTPFGNHWAIVVSWWIWSAAWFTGSIIATIWLARLLAGLLFYALTTTPERIT